MIQMKESMYNEYFKIYGKHFVINTTNNKISCLNENDYKNLINNKIELLSKNCRKDLINNCMIISKDVYEIDQIKNNYNNDKISKRLLDITIITSLNCNFRCTYCYESHNSNNKIDLNSSKSIVDFIHDKLKEGYEELLVTWYGGEPLLLIDLIYNIEQELNDLCKRYNTKYNSYITTNGYLINNNIINKLKGMYLQNVCITLDGNKIDHDDRRKLVNGKGTFDKIIENITLLKNSNINCVIRINIDKENIKNIKELTNLIKNKLKCNYYFAQVKDYSNLKDSYNKYLTNEEFAIEQFKNVKEIPYLPRILSTPCRATRNSNYIIDADLNVYSCAFAIDNKKGYIGNLKETSFIENDFYKWNPFEFEKCNKCNILPYCLGGCVLDDLSNKSTKCMPIKYNYKKLVEEYIKKFVIDSNKIVKLRESILFRKEKDYILICDCKNLYDFTLSLNYYDLLCKLKCGIFKDLLTKEEREVLKDFKKLNFLANSKLENNNTFSRIQYNESEFFK